MRHLLLFMVVLNTSNQVRSTEIIFTNGSSVVAIGTPYLHFRRDVHKMDIRVSWNLQETTHRRILTNKWESTTDSCNVIYANTALYFSSSCQSRNETHFTSTVTLKPIPPNVLEIECTFGELSNQTADAAELHSTHCPNITSHFYLTAYNSTKAVYNQQARFSCSKGELYDGSSINPDYYRTCLFDAIWSGEMPQCWIAPNASITTPDKLISKQNVSFLCEVTEGNPESFNITFNLMSNIVSKYNVGINYNVVLPVVITPDMNEAALACKVRNAYKETIVKKTLNVLYGPISNNRVLYAEATYGKPLNVSLTFTANPTISRTTTNLTKIDFNTTTLNSLYQIRSLGGMNHVFEWKIGNFTTEYEGNYTFTAWSVSAPEILVKSFELKVGSSSTTLPPTIPTTTTSLSVTNGGISIGALVGVAVGGSILLISVVIVVFIVLKRKNKQGTIPRKPIQTINVQETPIYQNQLTDSPGIEPKYEEISREQRELHEDPMPTYENTKNVTYENVKRNQQ